MQGGVYPHVGVHTTHMCSLQHVSSPPYVDRDTCIFDHCACTAQLVTDALTTQQHHPLYTIIMIKYTLTTMIVARIDHALTTC